MDGIETAPTEAPYETRSETVISVIFEFGKGAPTFYS